MNSTQLVTQAAVSGFSADLATVERRLETGALTFSQYTKALAAHINSLAAARRQALASHAALTVSPAASSPAHAGLTWTSADFHDSTGNLVGDKVVLATRAGEVFHIPASVRADGVCHAHCDNCGDDCCCYGMA